MFSGIHSRWTALLLAGTVLMSLSGCFQPTDPAGSSGSSSGSSSPSQSTSGQSTASSSSVLNPSDVSAAASQTGKIFRVPAVTAPAPTQEPDQSQREPENVSLPEQEPAEEDPPSSTNPTYIPVPSSYNFSQPVPVSAAVDNSYFADAAFVGDSRTDGLLIYSGIGCGTNLTSNGLSIFDLSQKKALTIGGQKYTLLEALALKQYGKVYLSLGVNELGVYNDEGFYRSYCAAIDSIRASQPNAVIYIQGLIPLNEGVIAQTIKRDYLTNEHLTVYNNIMKRVAAEKQVAFLDLHTEFLDENGELPADASNDGVHLLRDGYKQWLAYLKTHTVSYETLYPTVPVEPEVSAQAETSTLPDASVQPQIPDHSEIPTEEQPE